MPIQRLEFDLSTTPPTITTGGNLSVMGLADTLNAELVLYAGASGAEQQSSIADLLRVFSESMITSSSGAPFDSNAHGNVSQVHIRYQGTSITHIDISDHNSSTWTAYTVGAGETELEFTTGENAPDAADADATKNQVYVQISNTGHLLGFAYSPATSATWVYADVSAHTQDAVDVPVDVTNFGQNIPATATTVQAALDALDNLTLGSNTAADISVDTTNLGGNIPTTDDTVQKVIDRMDNLALGGGGGGGTPLQFTTGTAAPDNNNAISGTSQIYYRVDDQGDIISVSYSASSESTWSTVDTAQLVFTHGTTAPDDVDAIFGDDQIYLRLNANSNIVSISYSQNTEDSWTTNEVLGQTITERATYWILLDSEPNPTQSYTITGTIGTDGRLAPNTGNRFYETPEAAVNAASNIENQYPLWKIDLTNINDGERIITVDPTPVGHSEVVHTYHLWGWFTTPPPTTVRGAYLLGSHRYVLPGGWDFDPGSFLNQNGTLYYCVNRVNTNTGDVFSGFPVAIQFERADNIGEKIAEMTISAGTYSWTNSDRLHGGGWALESGIPSEYSIEQSGGNNVAVNLPSSKVETGQIGHWLLVFEGTDTNPVCEYLLPLNSSTNTLIDGLTDSALLRVDPTDSNDRQQLSIEAHRDQTNVTITEDIRFEIHVAESGVGEDGEAGRRGINAVTRTLTGTFKAIADITDDNDLHWVNDASIGNFQVQLSDDDIEYWGHLQIGTLITGRINAENYVQARITQVGTIEPYLYEFEVLDIVGYVNGRTDETIYIDSSQAESASGINSDYTSGDAVVGGEYIRYRGLEYYVLQDDDGTLAPPDEQPTVFQPLASAKLRAVKREARIQNSPVTVILTKREADDGGDNGVYDRATLTFTNEIARNSWIYDADNHRWTLDAETGTFTIAAGQDLTTSVFSVHNNSATTVTINEIGMRLVKNKGQASEETDHFLQQFVTQNNTIGANNSTNFGNYDTTHADLTFADGDTLSIEVYAVTSDTSRQSDIVIFGIPSSLSLNSEINASTGVTFDAIVSDFEFDSANRVWSIRDEEDTLHGILTPAGTPADVLKAWHDERNLAFKVFYLDTNVPTDRYETSQFTWNATDSQFDIPAELLRTRPTQITNNLYTIILSHSQEEEPVAVEVFPTMPISVHEIQKIPPHIQYGFKQFEPVRPFTDISNFENYAYWSFSRSASGNSGVDLCDLGFYSVAADGTATLIEDDVTFQSNAYGKLDIDEIAVKCTEYRTRATDPIGRDVRISARLKGRHVQIIGTLNGTPTDLNMNGTGVIEIAYSTDIDHISWSALGDSGVPMGNPLDTRAEEQASGMDGFEYSYLMHFKFFPDVDGDTIARVGDGNSYPSANADENGLSFHSNIWNPRNLGNEDYTKDSMIGYVVNDSSGSNDVYQLFANGVFQTTHTAASHSSHGLQTTIEKAYIGDVLFSDTLSSESLADFNTNILKTRFDDTGLFGHIYNDINTNLSLTSLARNFTPGVSDQAELDAINTSNADGINFALTDTAFGTYQANDLLFWDGANWRKLYQFRIQYSASGIADWHNTRDHDEEWYRLVINGAPSPALLVRGAERLLSRAILGSPITPVFAIERSGFRVTWQHYATWDFQRNPHFNPNRNRFTTDGQAATITTDSLSATRNLIFVNNESGSDNLVTRLDVYLRHYEDGSTTPTTSLSIASNTTPTNINAGEFGSFTVSENQAGTITFGPTDEIRIEIEATWQSTTAYSIKTAEFEFTFSGTYHALPPYLYLEDHYGIFYDPNLPAGERTTQVIDYFRKQVLLGATSLVGNTRNVDRLETTLNFTRIGEWQRIINWGELPDSFSIEQNTIVNDTGDTVIIFGDITAGMSNLRGYNSGTTAYTLLTLHIRAEKYGAEDDPDTDTAEETFDIAHLVAGSENFTPGEAADIPLTQSSGEKRVELGPGEQLRITVTPSPANTDFVIGGSSLVIPYAVEINNLPATEIDLEGDLLRAKDEIVSDDPYTIANLHTKRSLLYTEPPGIEYWVQGQRTRTFINRMYSSTDTRTVEHGDGRVIPFNDPPNELHFEPDEDFVTQVNEEDVSDVVDGEIDGDFTDKGDETGIFQFETPAIAKVEAQFELKVGNDGVNEIVFRESTLNDVHTGDHDWRDVEQGPDGRYYILQHTSSPVTSHVYIYGEHLTPGRTDNYITNFNVHISNDVPYGLAVTNNRVWVIARHDTPIGIHARAYALDGTRHASEDRTITTHVGQPHAATYDQVHNKIIVLHADLHQTGRLEFFNYNLQHHLQSVHLPHTIHSTRYWRGVTLYDGKLVCLDSSGGGATVRFFEYPGTSDTTLTEIEADRFFSSAIDYAGLTRRAEDDALLLIRTSGEGIACYRNGHRNQHDKILARSTTHNPNDTGNSYKTHHINFNYFRPQQDKQYYFDVEGVDANEDYDIQGHVIFSKIGD